MKFEILFWKIDSNSFTTVLLFHLYLDSQGVTIIVFKIMKIETDLEIKRIV